MTEENPHQNGTKSQKSEPIFTLSPVLTGLIGVIAAIHLAQTLVLDEEGRTFVWLWFGFIPFRLLSFDTMPSELWPLLWTPVTHAFLHSGWDHLILNIAWLAIFGTPVVGRYGAQALIALFVASAVAGALIFAASTWGNLHVLVGASGGIAGLMGAAVRFMFQPVLFVRHPETGEAVPVGRKLATIAEVFQNPRSRALTVVWLLLNLAMPVLPLVFGQDWQIAWEAHLGGFVFGFLVVPLLEQRQETQDPF